jgi:hypothetical protein
MHATPQTIHNLHLRVKRMHLLHWSAEVKFVLSGPILAVSIGDRMMTTSMKILAAAMLLSVVAAAPAFAQVDASQKPERLESEVWAGKSLAPSASFTDTPGRFSNDVYQPANRDAGNLVEKTWASRYPDATSTTAVRDPNHVIPAPGPKPADRSAAYYDSLSALFAGTPAKSAQRS